MLLDIKGLQVSYRGCEVVRGVDFRVGKGECVGLVGESGCGKTTVGLAVTRLIDERGAEIRADEILFDGKDILKMDREELRNIRGRRIAYVFQEPFSSLNPVFTIHAQLKEALAENNDNAASVPEILESVGLGKIANKKRVYPHELSGGMQQRVMIAMAIASKPDLLILDEPTTALDVTVQNQVLELIIKLKNKMDLSIIFISHDLRIVQRLADRVGVMYAGKIVEEGLKEEVFPRPSHPYTMGLINSIPDIENRKKRFDAIGGKAPVFSDLPKGCKFHPRCKFKIERCTEAEPELYKVLPNQFSRCIRTEELSSYGTIKNR